MSVRWGCDVMGCDQTWPNLTRLDQTNGSDLVHVGSIIDDVFWSLAYESCGKSLVVRNEDSKQIEYHVDALACDCNFVTPTFSSTGNFGTRLFPTTPNKRQQ